MGVLCVLPQIYIHLHTEQLGRGEQSQGSKAGEQGDKFHTSFFLIVHYREKSGGNLCLKLSRVKPV